MAEINVLILNQLAAMQKILEDIRLGMSEVIEEDLLGVAVGEQTPAVGVK